MLIILQVCFEGTGDFVTLTSVSVYWLGFLYEVEADCGHSQENSRPTIRVNEMK
jgi:hypothetical protein